MLLVFSGDPYLARIEASKEARFQNLPPRLLPPSEENLRGLLSPGLFETSQGILDFSALSDEDWQRAKAYLEAVPEDRNVLIYDPKPTSGRTRWYKRRAEVRQFPTPRFRERVIFVQNLFKAHGIKAPAALAHLLAESNADTEGLVREVEKLALLEGPLTPERVKALLGAPPASSAFDLMEKLERGELGEALALADELMRQGENPLRILGALAWHYAKLTELALLHEENPRLSVEEAARALGVAPFSARKLVKSLRRTPPEALEEALAALLTAELRAKTGSDPRLALEAALVKLGRKSSTPAP